MRAKNKAIFLDRDGTIIEDSGYIKYPHQIQFFPETIKALQMLSRNFLLFIVTNQVGIERGFISSDNAQIINTYIKDFLLKHKINIIEFFTCPHDKNSDCICRKPSPHFLFLAAKKYNLDLSESFMLGDHPSDVLCAENACSYPIYLLTGHGQKHRAEIPEKTVVLSDILSAAEWIDKILEVKKIYGRNLQKVISSASKKILEDKIGIIPTETVYGLAANALSLTAVSKIFETKKRPLFNPLIVHVDSIKTALSLIKDPPEIAIKLMLHFWPGPLTLVLPKKNLIPDIVTAGLPTVAIRMPQHPITLELLKRCKVPLAAPSANPFSQTSPTTFDSLDKNLLKQVSFAINGGKCSRGIESTVISFNENNQPVLLRPGALPIEKIAQICGTYPIPPNTDKIQSPGQLKKHYAPKTPLQIISSPAEVPHRERKDSALLSPFPCGNVKKFKIVQILSKNCDLREAASNLFGSLNYLDSLKLRRIYALLAPETGLGIAINDRLKRASS